MGAIINLLPKILKKLTAKKLKRYYLHLLMNRKFEGFCNLSEILFSKYETQDTRIYI